MHRERLEELLGLSDGDISRLYDCGLILSRPEKPPHMPRIDYQELARSYRKIMEREGFASNAELARHLGVSRVWVSRVLKGIRRKSG